MNEQEWQELMLHLIKTYVTPRIPYFRDYVNSYSSDPARVSIFIRQKGQILICWQRQALPKLEGY